MKKFFKIRYNWKGENLLTKSMESLIKTNMKVQDGKHFLKMIANL